MAMHEIPDDGNKHLPARDCPCRPKAGRRRVSGVIRTVYVHKATRGKHPEMAATDQPRLPAGVARLMPPADPQTGPEAECGHVVVETDAGEWQHHQIPDDGAPHAPTSECGCAPQRVHVDGHVVYEHADQDGSSDDDEDRDG